VILFVPFIIYEDITIIQNEEPINRVFFAMVKNNCALRVIGGMDCGLNVGGRGVVIGVAECVLSFFFFLVCVCVFQVLYKRVTFRWARSHSQHYSVALIQIHDMLLLLLTMSIQLSVLQSCLIGYPKKKKKKICKMWFIWDLRENCNSLLNVLVRASWLTSC